MSKNIENAIQAIYKNGKWYVGGGTGGTSIIYADSVDALPDPATVPEGTIALVPVNDEVVDLTGVFDYATSIMQGGALCRVSHDCTELLNRLKKGAVRIKGGLDGYFSTNTVLAQIIDDFSGGHFVECLDGIGV